MGSVTDVRLEWLAEIDPGLDLIETGDGRGVSVATTCFT
jgi:hypothetical protein